MTVEAKVMRIASSTMRDVRMKTWLAASAPSRPTTAMPPQAMPLPSSSQVNLLRQVSTLTSPRGCARKRWQAAIMKNFMAMTVASHAEACTTGAQNIEASEKMTASSGSVTRADSSLRANIDRSSYSNSGFRLGSLRAGARAARGCAPAPPPAGPWRVGGGRGRCCRCCCASSPLPGRPADANPNGAASGAPFEAPENQWKSLNSRLSAQSGQHGLLPPPSSLPPIAVPARPCTVNFPPLPLFERWQVSEAPMKILRPGRLPTRGVCASSWRRKGSRCRSRKWT